MAPVLTTRNLRLGALVGGTLGAYALAEAKSYRLMRHMVPVGRGVPPLRILHLADTHLLGSNRRLIAFLEKLPDLIGPAPDLVLATGDMIEDDTGTEPLVEALGRIEGRLGRYYVLGSHDYYRSSWKGMGGLGRALLRLDRTPITAFKNDVEALEAGLKNKGWVSVLNSTATTEDRGKTIRISGTDDPYLKRHRTDHARRSPDDALAIALIHAPDIVSEWLLTGFDLVLAGHTHGGQVRAPFIGALVANCTIPLELASGLHPIGRGWLHVSPGLGTGRFQPIRFLARPEATLLELVPGAGAPPRK